MVRDVLTIATQTPGEVSPLNGERTTEYDFASPRMGIPTLTATLMHEKCLDKVWTNREYVTLRGERYYLRDTPTSSKSNTDSRYKHELNFVSEREILNQVYFHDTVESYSFSYDKPCTNSTTFTFFGTIFEFVDRANCALLYAGIGDSILKTKTALTTDDTPVGDGYCVMLDPNGDYDPNEVKEMSFTDQYIWAALTTGYETYKIPFVFKGKACIFGAVDEVIDHTFQYGRKHELLSVTKQNANAQIINRITFKGSSENIPYYYPNSSEYGHIKLAAGAGNSGFNLSHLTLVNPRKLLAASTSGTPITYGVKNKYVEPSKIYGWQMTVGDKQLDDWEPSAEWNRIDRDSFEQGDEMRPEDVVKLTLEFSIKTQRTGTVEIKDILGQIWFQNDAPPDKDRSLITGLINVSKFVDAETNDDLIEKVSADDTIIIQSLSAGDYRIALEIEIVITHKGNIEGFFWRVSNVLFEKGESQKGWFVGDKFYTSIGNFGVELSENANPVIGDSFFWTANGRMPFQTNLVPPIYRNTEGAERFYNATNFPETEAYVDVDGMRHPEAYIDPDTGQYYDFKRPFTEGNPDEYIFVDESIKPTIEGVTNADGELFGEIVDIAYDSDDSDSLKANVDQEDDANTENYAHSFFYIKLNIFNGPYGFDLFAQASQTDAMTLQMTTGKCAGCKFKIQAEELGADNAKEFANPVQTTGPDGTIVDGTYTDKVKTGAAQEWQQNTQTNSVWICVQKDAETFGVIMPNVEHNYKPAVGDKFNIINIDLPEAYILAAEKRGEEAMMRYMSDNNEERFNFEIDCSRIFFAQNPKILAELSESSKIRVKYDGEVYEQFVSNMAISCKDGEPLPQIKLTLANELSVGQGFAERVAARVASLIATPYNLGGAVGTGGGANTSLTERRYLNKQKNDRTPYKLSSDTAFELGEFISGSSGGMFGVDQQTGQTFLETDILRVRMKAVFERLEVVEANSVSGKTIITPGGGVTISFVEPIYEGGDDGAEMTLTGYRCYFKAAEDGKEGGCRFRVGDLIYCQDFKIEDGVVSGDMSGTAGNHFYWRKLTEVNNAQSYFVLSNDDCASSSDEPQVGDTVIQLGSKTDNTRQSAIIFSTVDASAPSVTLFDGIKDYTLNQREVVAYGVDKTKNPPEPFFNCYGRFFFGPRDKSSYLQFNPSTKSLEFRGTLSIESAVGEQGLIDFIKANGGLNEDVENFVNNAIKGVQDQIDGVIETWFYNGVPTLDNYPAVNWTTDDLKEQHLGDLYYDNLTGLAYRFSKDEEGNYYWNDKVDSSIAKALADAQKAKDAADGKRRVFTTTPKPPYDDGDLWANATYPEGTTSVTRDPDNDKYHLDLLRCKKPKTEDEQFDITDWCLASNYTDDTVANEAKNRVAKWAEDGIFSPMELQELAKERERVASEHTGIVAQWNSYADNVKNNVEGCRTTYNAYVTAEEAYIGLLDAVLSAPTDQDGCVEVPSTFMTALSDYYTMLAQVKYILSQLQRSFSLTKIADYEYLKEALKQRSYTEGGLFLTSLISLGVGTPENRTTYSGINGIWGEYKQEKSIAIWFGGDMVDLADYYNWENNAWVKKPDVNINGVRIAQGLDRMDGSGYRAGGKLWWDTEGNVHADPLSFFVGENAVGLTIGLFRFWPSESSSFNDITSVTPQKQFTSLRIGSQNDTTKYVELEYDTERDAIHVKGNIYADGFLSAKGIGGAVDFGAGITYDDLETYLSQKEYATEQWVLEQGFGSGGGLDADALADYLSENGYATHQWVQDKGYMTTDDSDDRYIKRDGDVVDGDITFDGTIKFGYSRTSNTPLMFRFASSDDTIVGSFGADRTTNNPVWASGVSSKWNTIWHEGNDGAGSGLDADLLDGKHLSDILASNVASATQLANARNLWGQSFDGTGDVSGDMTDVGNITTTPLDGRAIKAIGTSADIWLHVGQSGRHGLWSSTDNSWLIYSDGTNTTLGFNNVLPSANNQHNLGSYNNAWLTTYCRYVAAPQTWWLRFQVGASTKMTINSSGYVGIGTESPAYLLDVSGAIRTTGAIRAATAVIGSGTISWDSAKNMFKFSHGIYTEGTLSAKGFGDVVSGDGGSLDASAIEAQLKQWVQAQDYIDLQEGDGRYVKKAGDTMTGYLTATGFKRTGSSDSYMLLGGGGHKTLTSLFTDMSVSGSTLSVTVGGTTKTATLPSSGGSSGPVLVAAGFITLKPTPNSSFSQDNLLEMFYGDINGWSDAGGTGYITQIGFNNANKSEYFIMVLSAEQGISASGYWMSENVFQFRAQLISSGAVYTPARVLVAVFGND